MSELPEIDKEKFAVVRENALELVQAVDQHKIRSEEAFNEANELMLQVKNKYRTISTALRSITDPLETSKRNAHLLFDPVLSALARAEIDVKSAMGNWKLAEKARKDEEARVAKEKLALVQKALDEQRQRDADAAAEAARKKALDEAKAAGLSKKKATAAADLEAQQAKQAALDAPKPVLVAKPVAPVEQSFATESGRSNVQFEYDYELVDVVALDRAFPELVEKVARRRMILDRLKATDGAPLPGIVVKTRAKVTGIV